MFNVIKKKISKFSENFKNIDKKIMKFMKKGFLVSYFMVFLAILLLVIYKNWYISYDLVEASIILFKTSLFFVVQFFICGIAVDKIVKMNG